METKNLNDQLSVLLENFDSGEACAVLRKLGGFHDWIPKTMLAEINQRVQLLAAKPAIISINSGGLFVGKDQWGFLVLRLDVYGEELHPNEIKQRED